MYADSRARKYGYAQQEQCRGTDQDGDAEAGSHRGSHGASWNWRCSSGESGRAEESQEETRTEVGLAAVDECCDPV